MAKESNDIRNKTRLVKNHILSRFLKFAEIIDNGGELATDDLGLYKELTMKFAPNCVPRSTEITGEDGEAIKITFDKAFQNESNFTPETE